MDLFDGLYVALLLAINGYFVAAEFALVKVRISQIDALAASGNWAAKLTSKTLDRLDAYLSASQLGITVASLALGNAIHDKIEPGILRLFQDMGFEVEPGGTGWMVTLVPLMALCLVTFLHMAIGEQAPKNLAIRYPKAVSLLSAPALVAFTFVFWPIIWLLNSASNLLLKVLGLGGASHAELAHTEEELRHILGESAAGGVLSRRERHMIENVLNLEEKTAQRVIVPRADIVYLSLAQPLEENLRLARQSGHTRYPLCVDDLTRVVGMVHVKDLFRALQAGGRVDLRQVARKVPFVSLSLPLDKLLLEFQRNRVHMAMLLDEEGKHVVGMAFLEDVLEELVGPIQDEFDKESPHIQDQGDGVYRVSGLCPIDELAEVCQMNIPETDMATVAGLVLEHLGRMANPGDSIEVDSRRITVVEAEPTRIHLLRVEPIPAPDGDE